jgi:hypothetical protein
MRLRNPLRRTESLRSPQAHLRCETLEAREAPAANLLGINLSGVEDWSTDRMFADAMMSARRPSDFRTHEGAPPIDANGWPTTDASFVVWHGIDKMNGTYRLSFTGQADVTTSWGATTIRNKSYDSATNTTTVEIIYESLNGAGLLLNFANTRRTPASPLNSGVTNVKLMRPIVPGSTTSYDPSVTFTQPLKDLVNNFSVVRMMDNTGSNGAAGLNGVWANRRTPSYASQAAVGAARGMAWEYAIQFWNETDRDAWVNIPFPADDNYVTQLATLLKNTLEPGRRIYVEYSNELWNFHGGFPGQANRDAAIAEVQANPNSPLNFDGIYPSRDPNGYELGKRRIALRAVQISNIFRQVFGDAEMMTRVRPVLMSQLGWAAGWLAGELDYIEDYFNNPTYQATPRPVSHFLYGAGGSAYQDPDWSIGNNITVDQIFATMPYNFTTAVQQDMDWVAAFGLKRIAYEGGPALDNIVNNQGVPTSTLNAAWADPRMRTELVQNHNAWSAAGGDLLMYFASTGGCQWGMTFDCFTPVTQKMLGIADLNASQAAPATYGKLAPVDLIRDDFRIPYWPGNIGDLRANSITQQWNGAIFRVDSAGTFSVRATATSSSGGRLEIVVDGRSVGTIDVPASGDTATIPLGTLEPGVHGIIIRAVAGSFGLSRVSIVAGTPLLPPNAPTNLSATPASWSSIQLAWTDQSDNETAFVLERATNPTFTAGFQSSTLAANTTSHTDTGLLASTTYYYRVRATNAAGSSAYSNVASATTPAAPGSNGLAAIYFDNKDFTGPYITRTDPMLDFYWTGSPATGIGGDTFSVRWMGRVQAIESGTHQFRTFSDDGVRLWVNGRLIVNNWTDHASTYNMSSLVTLTAGQRYDIRMDFYENTGGALARLEWKRPGQNTFQFVPQSQLYPLMGGPVLFADSFDFGFGNWGPASGSWGIVSSYGGRSRVSRAANNGGESLSLATTTWTNYTMAAWVNLNNLNGGLGIIGRATDKTHYYELEVKRDALGNPSWFLNVRDGGTTTTLASGLLSYSAGTWLRLRLTMIGDTLTAESSTDGENYTQLGSATDSRYTSGRVGLRAWNSAGYFDDVVVQGG